MDSFGDLFAARQQLALVELTKFAEIASDNKTDTSRTLVAMCIDKVAMQNSTCCRWKPSGESLVDTFGRQALPMVWDFAESVPIGGSTGDFKAQLEWIAESTQQPISNPATVQLTDAANHPLPDQSVGVWFTDPALL